MAHNHGCTCGLGLVPETHRSTTSNRHPRLYPKSLTSTQYSHLTIIPLTSLGTLTCSSFHSCLELDLNEPCLVFLLLTCALCNDDSGSSPTLSRASWVRLLGSTLPCSPLYTERKTQTRNKQVLMSHKRGDPGISDTEISSPVFFLATSSTGLRFYNVQFPDIILNTFGTWETRYFYDCIILSVLIWNADAPPQNWEIFHMMG